MQRRLLSAGVFLVLVAFALPGQGYHIEEDPLNTQNGLDPQEWRAVPMMPIADPDPNTPPSWDVGGPMPPFSRCEQPPAGVFPGSSGANGLCFMSPGFDGSPCLFVGVTVNQGNSNGKYDAASGACQPAPPAGSSPAGPRWFRLTMQNLRPAALGTNLWFVAHIGGNHCGGNAIVYDDLFARTLAHGHVEGMPFDPAGGLGYGGYTIELGNPTGLTQCPGGVPMYYV